MPKHIEINQKNVARQTENIHEITSIHFGKDVESIDAQAFNNFSNLETVTFDKDCKINNMQSGTFRNCINLKSIEIPNSVTIIGACVFYNCKKLKSINVPNSIKTIEVWAFDFCGLESITIPNSVKTIGYGTFHNCENIKSITIPNSVQNIGHNAFHNCKSLGTITIPNSVKSIDNSAFTKCDNLTEINFSETKINGLDFSDRNQITQKQLDDFRQSLQLPVYCNIKIAGQIIEPDSNAKIEQCKAILESNQYTDELKAVIRSQMAYSLRKKGDCKQALEEINTLRKSGYLKNNDLSNCPEWKKQCLSNCNKVLKYELDKIGNQFGYLHAKEKCTKKALTILEISKKKQGRDM